MQTNKTFMIIYSETVKHTTWVLVIVFGCIQLISEPADVLMSHRQPPGCLLQILFQPLPLISLPGNLFIVGLI